MIIPQISNDKIWSITIIDNLPLLFKPEFLKKLKIFYKFESGKSPHIVNIIFEKLQIVDKESTKKVLELLQNLVCCFLFGKANIDEALIDSRGFTYTNFKHDIVKLKAFKSIDDTGLVITKIIFDFIQDEHDSLKAFITSTVSVFLSRTLMNWLQIALP